MRDSDFFVFLKNAYFLRENGRGRHAGAKECIIMSL